MEKRKSIIAECTRESNLKSDVVRVLAFILGNVNFTTIKEVYKQLHFYVKETEKDVDTLVSQGILWLFNRRTYSYSYYDKYETFTMKNDVRESVLSDIPEDMAKSYKKMAVKAQQADYYCKLENQDIITRANLAYALWELNHHQDSGIELLAESINKGLQSSSESFREESDSYIKDFAIHCLQQSNKTAELIAQRLSLNTKEKLRQVCQKYLLNMQTDADSATLYRLYFDADNRPYDVLMGAMFMLQTELMTSGHIDLLLEKYAHVPQLEDILIAIRDLHQGNSTSMIHSTQLFVKQYGSTVFSYPQFTFFVCAALLVDDSKEAKTLAANLYKTTLPNGNYTPMRFLLEIKLKGGFTKKTQKMLKDADFAQHICFALMAIHHQYYAEEKDSPISLRDIVTNINNTKMMYLRMLFAAEDDNQQSQYEKLCEHTGMQTFLPKKEKKKNWELKLDQLLDMLGAGNNKTANTKKLLKETKSRIIYLVNPFTPSVRPILQKTKDGVTWTTGRNIALKTFFSGNTEGMTETDRRVASHVQSYSYGYYGNTEYCLEGNKMLHELVGHPLLFTQGNNQLKIELTEEPLQLSVTKNKNGTFKLNTNVETEHISEGYYLDNRNATSLRIVAVTKSQQQLLEIISNLGLLPNVAKEKLSMVLNGLAGNMTVMSDLVSNEQTAKKVKASDVIIVQLVPEGERIRAQLFAKPFLTTPPYLAPGRGVEYVSAQRDGKTVQTQRNLKKENDNRVKLETLIQPLADEITDDGAWLLTIEQTLSLLESLRTIPKVCAVEWPEGVRMKVTRPQIEAGQLHVSVNKMGNWFEIEGEVDIDEKTKMKISELLALVRQSQQSRFVMLNDSEYVALSNHLSKTLRTLAGLTAANNKVVSLSTFNATLVKELEAAGADVQADKHYRQLMERIDESTTLEVKIPRNIQADLRDYQKEGYRWLTRLSHWGAGACLADDMGLGKTIQTITLLLSQRKQGASLVVAPASVLLNWRDELQRFAPSLNTMVLNTAGEDRATMIDTAKAGDVLITSYGLLITEQELLSSKSWNVAVLDEAHTIKNRDTKMAKAAMTLQADFRIALTGTPLQNRLSEIWNIFQFTNPGLLGSFQYFTDNFIQPIEKQHDRQRQQLLKRLISPFILRRTKNDVLSELPEKTEITLKVELSPEEQAYYETLREQAVLQIEESESNSAIRALAEITRLRQAACNVRLVDAAMQLKSSKAEAFMQLVDNMHANHHRALVFSQFTSHLALIREQLDAAGVQYLYLDGSTTPKQRALLVKEFQEGDTPLFLISLKAGGLGLNLTAADYVIHLDPWWNPAIEDQASDRSYRIGQQKPVTVYRLIASCTIEEKILRLHQNKKQLADALLDGTDVSARLTKDDILALLQERA